MNLYIWEQVVRRIFEAKNKLAFIDDTLQEPTPKEGDDKPELQSWEIVNFIICSWILKVIEPKRRTSATFVKNVGLMWDKLKKCYAVANAPKIHQLKVSLVERK